MMNEDLAMNEESENLGGYFFKSILLPIGLFIGFWIAVVLAIIVMSTADRPLPDGWNSIVSQNQRYENGEQKYYLSVAGSQNGSGKISVDKKTFDQSNIGDQVCVKNKALADDSVCELKDEYDETWKTGSPLSPE